MWVIKQQFKRKSRHNQSDDISMQKNGQWLDHVIFLSFKYISLTNRSGTFTNQGEFPI